MALVLNGTTGIQYPEGAPLGPNSGGTGLESPGESGNLLVSSGSSYVSTNELTTITINTSNISRPTITGTKETKVDVSDSDIDLSAGNYFTKTISGDTTFTVSNVAATNSVSAFILDLTNGGSATVTWFSGVTWAAAAPPTLTASGVDTLGFFTYDGGINWRAFVLGQSMA